ncbi:MAG TPA: hypothetical protein VNM48_16960 [Chloroflexota bacterium]|nr:hypothetical protein [Chloroflexota bacterium]
MTVRTSQRGGGRWSQHAANFHRDGDRNGDGYVDRHWDAQRTRYEYGDPDGYSNGNRNAHADQHRHRNGATHRDDRVHGDFYSGRTRIRCPRRGAGTGACALWWRRRRWRRWLASTRSRDGSCLGADSSV